MSDIRTRDLVHLLTGRWTGTEAITIDPATQTTIEALGRFENASCFRGAGVRASYSQEVNGAAGLDCETVYRFRPEGEVTMVWFPADGDPQVFGGRVEGAVITVSRNDQDGLVQTLVSDYSQMGVATIAMTVKQGSNPPVAVFRGKYTRVGTAEGGAE